MRQAALERGEDAPDIPATPAIAEWLVPILEGFWALCRSRSFSMAGAMAIPVSEILIYHEYMGHGTNREEFLYLVQQMDDEWLKLMAPKKGKS